VTLHPVDRTNWRAITKLAVVPEQRDFVVEPCYYLVLYAYDQLGSGTLRQRLSRPVQKSFSRILSGLSGVSVPWPTVT